MISCCGRGRITLLVAAAAAGLLSSSSSSSAPPTSRMFASAFAIRSVHNKRAAVRLRSSSSKKSSGSNNGSSSSNSRESFSSSSSVHDDELPLEQYRNINNKKDQVFAAISGDGGIKVTAVTVRNLVNDMSLQHSMTPTPTDAIGRTVVCGLLMANGIQEEQVVQITMNGDGPLRGIVTIVGGDGTVRGYVGSPMLGPDIALPEAVGKGTVQIVKNHPDWPRPYNGICQIRHGDIDRDIGLYLAESEQRCCALAAATVMNGILCTAAGGYLIEQLPQVEPETVAKVEENLAKLVQKDGSDKLPTGLLLDGVTPLEIAEIVLDGLDMKPLGQLEPKLVCQCTEDRLFRSLRLLPREDVEDILEKQECLEARCQFCGKVYRMEAEELRERLDKATGDPSRE